MKNRWILLLCLILISNTISAQTVTKSIFLLVDRETDSIYENDHPGVKIRYNYFNIKQNFSLNLDYVNIPNYKGNHFIYLLPKEMIDEYKRIGNLQEITTFFDKFNVLSRKEKKVYLRLLCTPYFYEYLDGEKLRRQKRFNVFLFLNQI